MLNDAVVNGGKVAADLGAQLTTSRLVSLGFLSEAQKLGVSKYQVDEVLDDRTCPVCEYMNGKTFDVDAPVRPDRPAAVGGRPAGR